MAKVFRENTDKINSIDFSPNGETLISCSEDDQIVIYDCEKGTQVRTVNSKKYGVDLIHFTHAKNTAIHSSTKVDDTIRYLSLHDNKYIRYFPGHTKKVVSLCLSPVEDTFLSGSMDKTLRLWDLRSPNCQGLMHLSGRPVAAYDPEGLIFAAGVNSECIKLYDLRSFDKVPTIIFFYLSLNTFYIVIYFIRFSNYIFVKLPFLGYITYSDICRLCNCQNDICRLCMCQTEIFRSICQTDIWKL